MSFDHADLEGLVFLVSSIPSGFYTLSASSSTVFPDRDIRVECSEVSHSLHVV